jgi:BMFP domain-containing protein YqiC
MIDEKSGLHKARDRAKRLEQRIQVLEKALQRIAKGDYGVFAVQDAARKALEAAALAEKVGH